MPKIWQNFQNWYRFFFESKFLHYPKNIILEEMQTYKSCEAIYDMRGMQRVEHVCVTSLYTLIIAKYYLKITVQNIATTIRTT